MSEYLDRQRLNPYLVELHNGIGSAVWRGARLLAMCDQICELDRAQQDDSESLHAWGARRIAANQEVFDELEAFLSVWARVSLLLFPALPPEGNKAAEKPETKYRAVRGRTLRYVFGVEDDNPLSDRDYRDSWVHADERLDSATCKGELLGAQLFIMSRQLTQRVLDTHLRVVVVDTKEIHIRGRSANTMHVMRVDAMRCALVSLEAGLVSRATRLASLPAAAA